MEFDTSILREADIRGIYPTQINGDFAYHLGGVFGTILLNKKIYSCVVGHDNRYGGPNLTKTLIEGIISTGVDVIYTGLVTTPMFNFASRKLNLPYGIMITASHNPKEDNGFKLFGRNYQHCDYDELEEIYESLKNPEFKKSVGHGEIKYVNVNDVYAKYVAESVKIGNHHLRVVVDCGNGTASTIIRSIYDRLPFDVTYLYCDSNPNFPNHHPDPSVRSNLYKLGKAIKHHRADLGLAYDGDADRCGFVDNMGKPIEADLMMSLLAPDIIKNNDIKKVVVDCKCTNTLMEVIKECGGEYIMETPSSARQERLVNKENIPFGGGYSNHIFFHDRHPGYDDGIYVGLRVQEWLSNHEETLQELADRNRRYFNTEEIKVKTTDEAKFGIVDKIKEYCDQKGYTYDTTDGIRAIKSNGWALVRASNTGPNLTLRFESTTEKGLASIQKEFMNLLKKNK